MSVPMPCPKGKSSVVTIYEQEIYSAKTGRGFGHVMPNVMDKKVEHEQAGTPDNLRGKDTERKKEERNAGGEGSGT